ncbi:unnamed protein product [Rotaria sp. Silwood2]|nr:unnamed protein product [Rotaria sp. Silwood2]CAF3146615.1 unnamed protein product [Rotaria sp. Silwood2]CAF4480631.1 unnamed protein product [Rotaria sp. Silwood2]CAF4508871.1 unnamed protein product [Rotaria sp. Silwood2]
MDSSSKAGRSKKQFNISQGTQDDLNEAIQIGSDDTRNKEDNEGEYQYRQTRKRRNDQNDGELLAHATDTPKRRNTERTISPSNKQTENQQEVATTSYFNNYGANRKHVNNTLDYIYIHESSNSKQQREAFPPFCIKLKENNYRKQEVAIIKELNRKCKLSLTYGRLSSSNNQKCYLLYCNTAVQFETLLDKSKWPDSLCNSEYTISFPRRFPASYSLVVLNIPTQWDVQDFCNELKLRYKTIIKGERLYVKGGKPISKIRIDFSSNKELMDILKHKRILLEDENTAYTVEPYTLPTKILRCYICQQYDDHVAAHCPNKDKPICFKCGQQHEYNPNCSNDICCAHCKGTHMTGNPSCPLKIEIRENKKMQTKTVPSRVLTETNTVITNKWTGNSVNHLFGSQVPKVAGSMGQVIGKADNNHQMMEKLNIIEQNIQIILQQQTELNQQVNEINTKINNQNIEIINLNYILKDIVCPLLRDVTKIIYTHTNAQQKYQLNPAYNKLVSWLDQQASSMPFSLIQNFSKTTDQQRINMINTHTLESTNNNASMEINHESIS